MKYTVADVIAAWWAAYRPTVAETTAHRRRQIIDKHILPHIGDIPIKQLSTGDLAYIGSKTPSTRVDCHKVLRPALRWAMDQGVCKRNIMDRIPYPRYIPTEVEIYTLDELETLLSYLEGRWLWLPVYLASRTGLRRGEVCGLQWGDIDLEHGFLSVRRSISAISAHDLYVRPPKTERARRRVDLDPETITILQRHKQTAQSDWVCEAPRRAGGLPNPWHITKMLHDACKAAGIPHHTYHALRHTHATLLLAEGVPPVSVSERLGHSGTQITVDVYSHTLPTIQAPAVAAIVHIFSGRADGGDKEIGDRI